jgi:hypothetical protein
MAIIGVILYIVGAGLCSILNGFTLSVLWGWFIVPVFELPVLGIVPAIGLALVVGFLTHQTTRNSSRESTTEAFIELLVTSIVKSFMLLLIGWIVTLFL